MLGIERFCAMMNAMFLKGVASREMSHHFSNHLLNRNKMRISHPIYSDQVRILPLTFAKYTKLMHRVACAVLCPTSFTFI